MTGNFLLPTEIILEIYGYDNAVSTRALVRISAVNRHWRAIWLQDLEKITREAIRLKAPDDKDAVALALLETRRPLPITRFYLYEYAHAHAHQQLLRLHLPQLMRNIGLAAAICDRMPAYNDETGEGVSLIHPLQPVYYLTQKLVVAYRYHQLRPQLLSAVKHLTEGQLYDWSRMGRYLGMRIPADLPSAHGLHTWDDDGSSSGDDGSSGRIVLVERWQFAIEVGNKLRRDRTEDTEGEPDDHCHSFGGRMY